jgi:nitrous oxidase accessory protein NosD
MTTRMRTRGSAARTAAALLAAAGLVATGTPAGAAATARATTFLVRPGQSIQAAIDAAPAGSTVLIGEGSYRENLLIERPVTLRGRGHVLLEPPAVQLPNVCTESPNQGTVTWAACIVGELGPPDEHGVPTVVTPLPDVTVAGIHVRGFVEGLVALGTHHLTFDAVEIDRSGDAGINIVRSTDATIRASSLHGNHNFAVKVSIGDGITVVGNRIVDTSDGNGQGLNISQYRNVVVRSNRVSGNCTGVMVVDVVVPGTTRDVVVRGNDVSDNSRYCPGQGIPSASGNGIVLGGVAGALVSDNRVLRNTPSPDPATGLPADLALGGIALFDSTAFGGSAPVANVVRNNLALHNQPYDVASDGTGSDNVLRHNLCRTTNTPGACG